MIYLTAYLALALLVACLWSAIDATDGKHNHPGYYLARAMVWPVMLALLLIEAVALNTNPKSKRRWKGKAEEVTPKAAPVPQGASASRVGPRPGSIAATPQRPPTPVTHAPSPNDTGGRGGKKV